MKSINLKTEKYINLLKQIQSLVSGETDVIANMANISAVIKETFNFWWVGFYLVKENELVLGPFQGTVACTRIAFGRGVCGKAWKENRTIVVPDVKLFSDHIACSAVSRSEIVVPICNKDSVIAVLDIDSEKLNNFDNVDAKYLENIAELICINIDL